MLKEGFDLKVTSTPRFARRCILAPVGDWYLPSIEELSQLKKNLYDTTRGLAPGHFWSSTTTVAWYAWRIGTDAISDAPDQFLISSYATVCSVRNF